MKNIIIKNIKTNSVIAMGKQIDFASEQDLMNWKFDRILDNSWGKPEREILEFSESYDEADVISRRSEEVNGATTNYVTLKAEYVIEEKDLNTDPEWLLAECYRKRQAEYPTLQEIAEAIMEKDGEGRPAKFNQIHAQRMAVKAKYPKPSEV